MRFVCPVCDGILDWQEYVACWHYKEPDGCEATFEQEPTPVFDEEN